MLRSDEIKQTIHAFEHKGLGKAPFHVTGFSECIFRAAPDAPKQPGTCCDYCGTGIMYVCHIQSSDGKMFKVGCDCVMKTGDAGLIHQYKTTPEYRSHKRKLAAAKAQRVENELKDLFELNIEKTKLIPHPYGYQNLTFFDYITYMIRNGGAKGKYEALKQLKSVLV